MHSPHRPPATSPATSRPGDSSALVDVNATSSSSSSPVANSLHVPPPDQAWSGAALARALGSLAAPIDANERMRTTNGGNNSSSSSSGDNAGIGNGVSEKDNAAAGTATASMVTSPAPAPSFFNLPYNAVEGRPVLSFAALLPTPLPVLSAAARHAPHECAAVPSRTQQQQQQRTNEAVPPLVRRSSNSSFPSVSASRATAPGVGVDNSSTAGGHAESSSQRRPHRPRAGSPTSQSPTPGGHSPESSISNSRLHRHGGRAGEGQGASSTVAQKARSTAPSSFTDLFVGLERPRRYNQRQRQLRRQRQGQGQQQKQKQKLSHHHHRRRATQVTAANADDSGDFFVASASPASSTMSSPSLSTGQKAGTPPFTHDALLSDDDDDDGLGGSHDVDEEEESTFDVAEDGDGASTPTVYRSAELPHWWRSLVTPAPGTIVNLRPDTRRLEFWWIDRLGSEAYELISIVLRHNIEGTVLRKSGESAVVVEFRIPARFLGASSYAVDHPAPLPSPLPSPSPSAVATVAAPLSPSPLSAPASGPLAADAPALTSAAEPQHEAAAAALPAPLPLSSQTEGQTATASSIGNPTEVSIISLGHPGGDGSSSSTLGGVIATSLSPSVATDELPQSPQAPRLPGLVRLSNSTHVESLGHATTTTVNTNPTAATTVTTLVTSLAGARGAALLSPLQYLATSRQSEAAATGGADTASHGAVPLHLARSLSVPDVGGGGGLDAAATATSAPSSPGGHPSFSLVNGSALAILAGRSTDSSVEQDVQWRALARVLDTAASRQQQHQQQQQGSTSTPQMVQAASYSTDAAVVMLMGATATDGGRDGLPGAGAAAAASLSVATPRSPSAPARHHYPHPQTRCVKRLESAVACSANAAASAADGGAVAGGGTAATPPSSTALGFSVQSRCSQRSSTTPRGAGKDLDGLGGTAQQQQQQRLPPVTDNDAGFLLPVGTQLKARDVVVRTITVGTAAPIAPVPPPPAIVAVSLGAATSDNNCLSIVSRQASSEGMPRAHGQMRAVLPHPRGPNRQLPHIAVTSPQTTLYPHNHHHQHPLGNSTSTSVSTNYDAIVGAAAAVHLDKGADDSTNVPLPEFSRAALLKGPPQQPQLQLDANDDSVVAVLTLPASVCTPVVVVRLHAMGILHPLLRTLAPPQGHTLFPASSSDDMRAVDDRDSDGLEEALVTAANLSRVSPPSSISAEGKAVDHAAAVRILTTAIDEHLARHPRDATVDVTAASEEEKAAKESGEAAAERLRATLPGRDLSILYTVRSHVLFHSSATSLQGSLRDAEAALRCCAMESRINATYEILAANLVSFGYTAQFEGLASHLRHRWRSASPLLLRFARVTQVMVTYAAMFMRRQLPLSTLRLCTGGGSGSVAAQPYSNASSIAGGGGFAGASFMTMSVSAYSPKGLGGVNGAGALGEAGTGSLSTTGQAAAATSGVGDAREPGASPATAGDAGAFNTLLVAHAMPFEVCPLLMGHYGRTLHDAEEQPSQQPLPCVVSPLSKSIESMATAVTAAPAPERARPHSPANKPSPLQHHGRRPQRALRPSADVCHRRLFLLETIYPSMNPIPVSRLKSVLPLPLARRLQVRRSPRSTSLSSSSRISTGSPSGAGGGGSGGGGGGRTSPALSHAVVVPSASSKRDRKVRAEDFMYDRDSMLALLATMADTTMQWGTAPMRFFGRHIRLSATRRITKGETLLMERPALLMPLWPLSPPRQTPPAAGGSALETATVGVPQCCAQCGRQRLARFIPCPGACGSVYCTEQCRLLALRTYHIVECSAAPPDPHDSRVQERGDDDATRMRRAVAALRDVLTDWSTYLHHLARWDTPNTRQPAAAASSPPPPSVTPAGSRSVTPATPSPDAELPLGGASSRPASSQPTPTPSNAKASSWRSQSPTVIPPILAVTAMRAVARVGAMLICLVLPVELLPQMRDHPEWAAERHARLRAAARTLRQRGLVVPATTDATREKDEAYRDANMYCTNVDPHYLLLMEVLLQEMSIPFFADFNYRAPSTVWERLGCFPCQTDHSDVDGSHLDSTARSMYRSVQAARLNGRRNPNGPSTTAPYPSNAQQQQQQPQRNLFVELTPQQREEVLCDLHSMVFRVYVIIAEELGKVRALPQCSTNAEDDEDDLERGLPGRWNCVDLFGYLTSMRAFQQICDFCLTSWAVVYPRDLEPPNVAAAMAADARCFSPVPGTVGPFPPSSPAGEDRSTAGLSPQQYAHAPGALPTHRSGGGNNTTISMANDLSYYSQGDASTTLAVPLAVISPWACLTVDLHPILGNMAGGVLYSRFMVEHEQRRRMLAYCAAAAGRRGGNVFGTLGNADDSFLSVNSAVSTSAAALLSGEDSIRGAASLREDANLQLLAEAAQRSCSNLLFSLVYTPSNEVALVVTAKKNINLGDVLWWESVSCGEYLAAFL